MTAGRRIAVAALLAAMVAGTTPASPAGAIAHGSPVAHPEVRVPWVVALYQAPDGRDVRARDLICTATALDRRTLVTAAHCIEDLGEDALTVGYGAARLRDQRTARVTGIREHPGYDPYEVVHDLAVLRTGEELQIDRFPSLATRARARRARAAATRFTLYGWGDVDRTGILTGRLARARMRPRPGKARRVWGSGFDVRRQVAAGALRSRARAYPGACAGDSGGPLVLRVRHRPVLLGVTSFGAGRCGARSPTILTSVGHYRRWIIAEARALREGDETPTIHGGAT
jgi:secreted trypsin-like serine protease